MRFARLLPFVAVFCFVILAALVAFSADANKTPLPEEVATEFYKYHFSHDMAFVPDEVTKRAEWLTPDLLKACKAYFAIPEDPDEVPDIDGDPFTGSQEYPDEFKTGAAKIIDNVARVPLTFTWKEDHHSTQGVAVLKNVNGKWLIDDVQFPDQDSLRTLLANPSQTAPADHP